MLDRFTVHRTGRGLIAAGALMAAALAPILALDMTPAAASTFAGPPPAPAPGTCTPVEVTTAKLVRTDDGLLAIRVTGVETRADAVLSLDAENVAFVRQPDYWPYTVDECGGGRPVKTPFTADFRVPTNPVGRLGITVGDLPINLFLP